MVINYVEVVKICNDQFLNYTELENKVLDIINHGRYSTKEKIQDIKKRFFYRRNDISSIQLLKKIIIKIHSTEH